MRPGRSGTAPELPPEREQPPVRRSPYLAALARPGALRFSAAGFLGRLPAGRLTEGVAWLTSAISVGTAAGSAIAGQLVNGYGARWGYVFAAGCGAGAVLACLAGFSRLTTAAH